MLFEGDTEFSAVNPQAPPLLEVSIPIGARFRDDPGDIVNRSFALNNAEDDFVGLEVNTGKNITLLGGDINFEIGHATASGGNIYLGGLTEAGIVNFNEDGSLDFPTNMTLGNITLTNFSDIDVRGEEGGSITINAQNLSLSVGEFGESFIRGGIAANSISTEAQAGDITIEVAEEIILNDSSISNTVEQGFNGNSGSIDIETGSLKIMDSSTVDTIVFGRGNAGSINITATEDIIIDGNGNSTGIISVVNKGTEGDSGGITISTTDLNLIDGGGISASTLGQGDAAAVEIIATGDITIDRDRIFTGISSLVGAGAEGSLEGITISTTNLNLTGGARIESATQGKGNAGAVNITATGDISIDDENPEGSVSGVFNQVLSGAEGNSEGITISTTNLNLTGGARIESATQGKGNAGAVNITATGDISIDDENPEGSVSGVFNQVLSGAEGNSEGITISTTNLNLTNGGVIDSTTFGQGNAGAVNITATRDITANGNATGITSQVETGVEGNSGGITISTTDLNLIDGGRVDSTTFGQGNAGAINITATGDITANGNGTFSFITSGVDSNAEGNSEGITISTTNLNLTNGGVIDSATFGQGNGGAINIAATGDITVNGENSFITSGTFEGVRGNAGEITISTTNLDLIDGSRINTTTIGQGNGGAINITATGDITSNGNGNLNGITSLVGTDAEGNAGEITISTTNLNLIDGSRINATTLGMGNSGAINVTATGNITANGNATGITSQVETGAEGDSGGIIILTTDLDLIDGGRVDSTTSSQGNSGAINITATGNTTIDGRSPQDIVSVIASGVEEGAEGDSGGITLSTTNLSLFNGASILASTSGRGNAGGIKILAANLDITDGSVIDASTFGFGNAGMVDISVTGNITANESFSITSIVGADAEGDSGGIIISTTDLDLIDGGQINASTLGQGNAGAVNITATGDLSVDGENSQGLASGIISVVVEGSGDAGGINISTTNFNLVNGGQISSSTFDDGNAGTIDVTATDSVFIDGFGGGISANALMRMVMEAIYLSVQSV